jgi:ring-1,2-phenylacetyl-CoA epoxidase subunit PaaC
VDPASLEAEWRSELEGVLRRATLSTPPDVYMQRGGRSGRHTEHLGHLLAEMQIVARSFPGVRW